MMDYENKCKNKDHSEIIRKLISGEWVDSDKVQEALKMNFNECLSLFEFSRTAAWWSVVGETDEERSREGQKIEIKFRLKNKEDFLEKVKLIKDNNAHLL